jgi:hypothetical protein
MILEKGYKDLTKTEIWMILPLIIPIYLLTIKPSIVISYLSLGITSLTTL